MLVVGTSKILKWQHFTANLVHKKDVKRPLCVTQFFVDNFPYPKAHSIVQNQFFVDNFPYPKAHSIVQTNFLWIIPIIQNQSY